MEVLEVVDGFPSQTGGPVSTVGSVRLATGSDGGTQEWNEGSSSHVGIPRERSGEFQIFGEALRGGDGFLGTRTSLKFGGAAGYRPGHPTASGRALGEAT